MDPSGTYNKFGASADDVLRLYSGTVVDDYSAISAAGATVSGLAVIDGALERYSRSVVGALPERVRESILRPSAELILDRPLTSQTSASVSLAPVVAGSLRLYVYGDWPCRQPRLDNVTAADYSTNVATGEVTYPAGIPADGYAFATYRVDVESANFGLADIAAIVAHGAAQELGGNLYNAESAYWPQVERYRAVWDEGIELIRKGLLVPHTVAAMRWYQEIEAAGPAIGSVTKYRG